jgi:hypothetical protein
MQTCLTALTGLARGKGWGKSIKGMGSETVEAMGVDAAGRMEKS